MPATAGRRWGAREGEVAVLEEGGLLVVLVVLAVLVSGGEDREEEEEEEANFINSSRTRAICSEQQCVPNKPLRIRPLVGCEAWEKRDHAVLIEFFSSGGRFSRACRTSERT